MEGHDALHNWLKNWLAGPNVPRVTTAAYEPHFVHNALLFYQINQEALMALSGPIRNGSGVWDGEAVA